MAKKILFLVPYPLKESPSQRFRFEQYFSFLESHGHTYRVQAFLNSSNWRAFSSKGAYRVKVAAIVSGFAKRMIILFKSRMYDFVFIHREAAPLGPPVFEWILAKVLRRKIIYDFDDAIWVTDRMNESWLLRTGKFRAKVGLICKWSHKISCGNQYLCDYASTFNKHVVYNPTTIDTERLHNPTLYTIKDVGRSELVIGWTGSYSTLKYLTGIAPTLEKILSEYPQVQFRVIADREPTLPSLPSISFVPWNPATEIQDLMSFDIGLMPLPDDKWANGKCGFKALQYMALSFPAVASPVGVNSKIIDHEINGYLCRTPEEWELALRTLIEQPSLRKSMGANGRLKIIQRYSVRSNASTFLSLFE